MYKTSFSVFVCFVSLYNLPNPNLKISESYTDYYTTIENNTLRVAFISLADGNEQSVLGESQHILETLKQTKKT